jgi:hypothetical protein
MRPITIGMLAVIAATSLAVTASTALGIMGMLATPAFPSELPLELIGEWVRIQGESVDYLYVDVKKGVTNGRGSSGW